MCQDLAARARERHAGGCIGMDVGTQHLVNFKAGFMLSGEAHGRYRGTLSIVRLLPRITGMFGMACLLLRLDVPSD